MVVANSDRLKQCQQQMAQQLDALLAVRHVPSEEPCWEPAADMVIHGEQVVILIDLPGVLERDLTLAIEGRTLLVRGRRFDLQGALSYQRIECPRGFFQRRFMLPQGVELAQLSTQFESGVLQIQLPLPVPVPVR